MSELGVISKKARAWMRELLPDPEAALQDIDALSLFAVLSSVSLEGRTRGDARLKLYFRMREPRALYGRQTEVTLGGTKFGDIVEVLPLV